MRCMRCSRELDEFDIGCHLKLIHRGATAFLCRECIAKDIGWTREEMDRAIRRFQEQGCRLFPPLREAEP